MDSGSEGKRICSLIENSAQDERDLGNAQGNNGPLEAGGGKTFDVCPYSDGCMRETDVLVKCEETLTNVL